MSIITKPTVKLSIVIVMMTLFGFFLLFTKTETAYSQDNYFCSQDETLVQDNRNDVYYFEYQVRGMQMLLNDFRNLVPEEIPNALVVDDDWGPATNQAVGAFQEYAFGSADYKVGVETRRALCNLQNTVVQPGTECAYADPSWIYSVYYPAHQMFHYKSDTMTTTGCGSINFYYDWSGCLWARAYYSNGTAITSWIERCAGESNDYTTLATGIPSGTSFYIETWGAEPIYARVSR